MTIKDFGSRVVSVWEGLRPLTKKMVVGALETNQTAPKQKFSYDAHADWELSRLLSALDEQTADRDVKQNADRLNEIKQLAEACAGVLQTQTESAEVFIQLADRALAARDYKKVDELADALAKRFSVGEVCEIVRQTTNAAIRAVAFETLALMPIAQLATMLDDPIYFEIARNALEQQAFEYESEEARRFLEQFILEEDLSDD